jgi:MFS family permease
MLTINRTSIRNLTLLLGNTATVLAGAILAPALPGMAETFQDVPNAELLVRLALTMPALFIAIGAPFAGFLLDEWGRKPVIVASLVLYGVAGVSGFVLNTLSGILVGRALLGLAVAGIMSGFTTLIADFFTGPKLNQFMGYQGAFIGLGGMVFVALGGYLADIGWRFAFLPYAFSFVVLPGVLFAVDEPVVHNEDEKQVSGSGLEVMPTGTLAVIYATAFLGMLVFYTIIVHLPFYLTTQAGASVSQIGLALSLQSPSSIVIALLYQRLKARLSFQAIFSLVFLTLGINLLVIASTTNFGLIVAGLVIGGVGLGVMPPNVNVWVASIAPPAMRGRAVGGLTTALFLGQFLTPFVTQPLIGQRGPVGAFGVVGGAAILLTVIFAGIALRSERVNQEVEAG